MRASVFEKGMRKALQRTSNAATNVSLFVALSITKAVILKTIGTEKSVAVRGAHPSDEPELRQSLPHRRCHVLPRMLADKFAEVDETFL